VCSLLLAGCWDSRDPKTLDVVETIGFEPSPGGFTALVQVPTAAFLTGLLPGAGAGGGGGTGNSPPAFILAANGPTVPLALNGLAAPTGKAVYLGQARAVITNAVLARAGLSDLVDQLVRLPSIPNGVPLAVVDGPIRVLFQTNLVGTNLAGRFIDLFFRTSAPTLVSRVMLWTFFVALHTAGLAPTLPVFRMVASTGSRTTMQAEGTAIFRKGRMVDILTGADDLGLLMWLSQFDRQVLTVPSPLGTVTLDQVNVWTTFGLQVPTSGAPVLQGHVRVAGAVATAPLGLSPQDLQILDRATSAEVEAEMLSALHRLQRSGADAIGAGVWLNYHDPQAFARLQPWSWTFPHVQANLLVTTTLKTTGWGS
jgi:Ger(x)C family germination protein